MSPIYSPTEHLGSWHTQPDDSFVIKTLFPKASVRRGCHFFPYQQQTFSIYRESSDLFIWVSIYFSLPLRSFHAPPTIPSLRFNPPRVEHIDSLLLAPGHHVLQLERFSRRQQPASRRSAVWRIFQQQLGRWPAAWPAAQPLCAATYGLWTGAVATAVHRISDASAANGHAACSTSPATVHGLPRPGSTATELPDGRATHALDAAAVPAAIPTAATATTADARPPSSPTDRFPVLTCSERGADSAARPDEAPADRLYRDGRIFPDGWDTQASGAKGRQEASCQQNSEYSALVHHGTRPVQI